jgi:nickel-dependent lactate racemase
MSPVCRLRTDAWYGDREIEIPLPEGWDVAVHTPATPATLSDAEIDEALRHPVGQEPISRMARGRSRPLIIVDDLTRPTPAAPIIAAVLRQLGEAGIPASDVTILLATGTHRETRPDAPAKKVGPDAAAACRLLVHDDATNLAKVGRTSFGTPVFVNRAVLASDYVLGVGGVYPQHSTGFGGGSKLALGVLGRRSIARLHYGHRSMEGSYDTDNDFRRDLDEIAALIRLRTSVSAHVDADRQIVRLACGDHERYYVDAVAFALAAYRAPLPGDADVVISNAYPIDVSLTFMRSKGIIPLIHCKPEASRVLIAGCPEGVGHHGLFPFGPDPRRWRYRHMARRARARPGVIPGKLVRRAARTLRRLGPVPAGVRSERAAGAAPAPPQRPIALHAPGRVAGELPTNLPGMTAVYSWDEVIQRIELEQGGRDDLRVAVYPCAPLHVLDLGSRASSIAVPAAMGALD